MEKGHFRGPLAEIIPSAAVEGADGRWRAQKFLDVLAGVVAGLDLGQLGGGKRIAAGHDLRRAGQKSGHADEDGDDRDMASECHGHGASLCCRGNDGFRPEAG